MTLQAPTPQNGENTLKQFAGKILTNYLRVFDHFVGWRLKSSNIFFAFCRGWIPSSLFWKQSYILSHHSYLLWFLIWIISLWLFLTYFSPVFHCIVTWKQKSFKGALSGLRQILATESRLKIMKNAFSFTLKALFVHKIFKFFSWLFSHVEKQLD